jgi:hypothetical protein
MWKTNLQNEKLRDFYPVLDSQSVVCTFHYSELSDTIKLRTTRKVGIVKGKLDLMLKHYAIKM